MEHDNPTKLRSSFDESFQEYPRAEPPQVKPRTTSSLTSPQPRRQGSPSTLKCEMPKLIILGPSLEVRNRGASKKIQSSTTMPERLATVSFRKIKIYG
jgi:hypothetical protein